MKEIKFRQPIYENGKIIKWHYWGFKNGEYQLPINQHESYQFTGMKDKNKKEIYEGDFVKYTADIMWSAKKGIISVDTFAVVVWGYAGFTFKQIGKEPLRALNYEQYEVIGNKFQNPELIKGE